MRWNDSPTSSERSRTDKPLRLTWSRVAWSASFAMLWALLRSGPEQGLLRHSVARESLARPSVSYDEPLIDEDAKRLAYEVG
jgi:hypothetical protein